MRGTTGVYWRKDSREWMAQPIIHGKRTYLGMFSDKQEAIDAVRMNIRNAGPDPAKARMTPWMRRISLLEGVAWNTGGEGWISQFGRFDTEQEAWKSHVAGMAERKRKDAGEWQEPIMVPGFNGRYATNGAGEVLDVTTMRRAWRKDGMVRLDHQSGVSVMAPVEGIMDTGKQDVDPLDLPNRDKVEWDEKLRKWTRGGKIAPSQKSAWSEVYRKDGHPKQVIRRRAMLLPPTLGYYTEVDKNKQGQTPTPHRKVVIPTSLTPGVSFNKKAGKWVAYYKKKHIGSYGTEEQAKEALEAAKNG